MINEAALYTVCLKTAENLFKANCPQDSGQIIHLADSFFGIAKQTMDSLPAERDQSLVTRAVAFISESPFQTDNHSDWFRDLLSVLVRLACPDPEPSEAATGFLKDIAEGIRRITPDQP
jgi:hypothetical protein